MFHVSDLANFWSILRKGLKSQAVSAGGDFGVWLFYGLDDWNIIAEVLGCDNAIVVEVEVAENDLLADEDAIGPPGGKELHEWLPQLAAYRADFAEMMAQIDDDDMIGINRTKSAFITKNKITPDMAPYCYVGHVAYRSAKHPESIPAASIVRVVSWDWHGDEWSLLYHRGEGVQQRNVIALTGQSL
jgi:hypothetical protein